MGGGVFCFWGEGGLPRDRPLFIYFLLSPCMLGKRRAKAQGAVALVMRGSHTIHTHT